MEELNQSGRKAAGRFQHYRPVALTLCAGVFLSVTLFMMVGGKENERLDAEFERRASLPAAVLQRELEDHLLILRSIGQFFIASVEVDRDEFRIFTKEDLSRLRGIQAFEWLPRVPQANRDSFEKLAGPEARKHKTSDQYATLDNFKISILDGQGRMVPAGPQAEYFPVYYVEPSSGNLGRLGLDLGSYTGFRATMEAARNRGKPMASKPFPLGTHPDAAMAGRVFIAIYTNGVAHESPAERRDNLAGYASAVLHINKLVESSLKSLELLRGFDRHEMVVHLEDATGRKSTPLFESPEWNPKPGVKSVEAAVYVADRRWVLRCQATPAYLAAHLPWQGWVTLGGGLTFTGLIGAYLFSAVGRTYRVEQLVVERTAALAKANDDLVSEISERKRASEALAQERYLMNSLMDNVPDHIYFKDRQSRFLRVNKAMAALFKLSDPAAALGKTDFDFFLPAYAQSAFGDEQEIMRTGKPLIDREERETWRDGSVTWVLTTKECLRDKEGAIIGTFGTSRDITARKRAEERLQQQKDFLDNLIQHLPVAVFVKNAKNDFRFELWNDQAYEVFGLAKGEVIGKTDYDINTRELADRFRKHDLETIRARQVVEVPAEIFDHPTRGRLILHTLKVPLYDSDGSPAYLLGISEDITERKRAEEELHHTTLELRRSNSELEQFAYVASHDLQEPLRMIASYTQLLARRYQDKLGQDAQEFIGYAVDGALRMQGLITDLLAYSRLGTRGKPFQMTDCGEVLAQALANLKVAIEESGVQITRAPLPKVMGDPIQLMQLFQNLIGNAIKFRGDAPTIHVAAELDDRSPAPEWVFCVRDNGIGIEPQYFERIFVIFQRLHTRQQYPGTGIGLAVCKKIVERHGGRIWVESPPGQGAAFYFTIPKADPASL